MKTSDRLTEIAELKRIWHKTSYDPTRKRSRTYYLDFVMLALVPIAIIAMCIWERFE